MMTVVDLMIVAHDVDMTAVVRLVRAHAVQFRARRDTYSTAEVAVLAEALRWRADHRRPPVPVTLSEALAAALLREVPELDPEEARRLANGASADRRSGELRLGRV